MDRVSRQPARSSRTGGLRASVLLVAALAATAGVLQVGCGGDDSSGSGGGSNASSGPEAEIVASAKAVVDAGVKGLVAAKDPSKPELELDPLSDFAPVTKWTGPTEPVKAPAGKNLQVISCATVAPACRDLANGAVHAAQALGWKASYIDGKSSIQGYTEAFQTALNRNPDAIVAVALPESQLQTYIARAHAKDIPVVGVTVTPEKISNPKGHYDSYVTFREDSNALLESTWVINDSKGAAKVAFLWDRGYPFLVNQLKAELAVFKRCTGCKVEEVAYREFATAGDPVKTQQLATSLLQRHPDVQYVLLPYGVNAQSVALAAKTLGRNVKVVSKNADPTNVRLVHSGVLAAQVGYSTEWRGWGAVDDVIRLLNGQKPLGIAAHNVPLHYFVKSNAPASGTYDYTKLFDFKSEYLKLWGRAQ
jgi:ABC-type sugar transport system substrate-binding protein